MAEGGRSPVAIGILLQLSTESRHYRHLFQLTSSVKLDIFLQNVVPEEKSESDAEKMLAVFYADAFI